MNSTGKPYAWLPGAAGTGCDTLLSQPIDLSTRLPSDSVYISFHYQLGGYGDMPEFTDKLYVEFKNNVGNWVVIKTINGQTGTVPPFVQLNLYVGAAYLGNSSFQFRFRNVSSRQGARDHWHIDYVKMDKNRHWKEPNYDDIAFSGVPASSFTNYTAIPNKQFKALSPIDMANIIAANVKFRVFNHFSYPKTPILSVQVSEKYSGATIVQNVNPSVPLLSAGLDTTIVPTNVVGPASYNFGNLPLADSALLVVRYAMVVAGQDSLHTQTEYKHLNDVVERFIPLEDFFAYDDGSAESSIVVQNIGTQAAVKFRTVIADTLQGIRMNVPAFDISVANQLFNFSVYVGSLNSTPVYEAYNLHPSYGDSLQYWATYPFIGNNGLPPLIPANTDFYIVWQQGSTGQAIPIGFDKNSPQGTQFISQNTGAGWSPLAATISGALMLRPYLGSKRLLSTQTPHIKNATIAVYPNPTTGILTIDIPNETDENAHLTYTVFDALGRNVLTQADTLTKQIDISALQAGLYILQLKNAQHEVVGFKKIIKK